jgi:type IV pilus assembly protein PilF
LLYNRLGEYDKADISFRAALRKNPGNGFALNNYGQFLCQQKRYEEGQAKFLAAVKNPLYETPEIAYTNAGLCAQAAGNGTAAEDHFRMALERNPAVAPALLALAQLALDRKDPETAGQYFARFSKVSPQNPRSLSLGIRIESARGRKDQAASYEMMLRNQFPDSREAGQLQRGEL